MNRALLTGLAAAALLSAAAGNQGVRADDYLNWQHNFGQTVKTPKKKPAAAPKRKSQYLQFELKDATVSKFGKAPRRGRLRSR